MRIAMIGAGYVGLVSAACFADFGHVVCCVDTDEAKVAALTEGRVPFFEPGLTELMAKNARSGRLSFGKDLGEAMRDAEAVFIAVGTPSRRGDGHADLSYVFDAARAIANEIRDYTVVVTKSTVPVGTGDEIERIIAGARPGAAFDVVSNPEFLREGAAIADFKRPDRILIGAGSERAKAVMTEIYRPLYLNQAPLLFTTRRTAELTKYAANAFLATKITFINEMANLCEQVGANVQDVARGMGLDNRIGSKFLHAGPGYGGSCFPKDTLALIQTAQQFGAPTRIVEAVVAVNEDRKLAMARKVIAALGGSAEGKTVAVLGLTFKPNTDDTRESPAFALIESLTEAGARVRAYDPAGIPPARRLLGDGFDFAQDAYACAQGAHALVLVTEWDEFRALQLPRIRALLAEPVIVDLRNVYRPEEMEREGFRYFSIGRPSTTFPAIPFAEKQEVA